MDRLPFSGELTRRIEFFEKTWTKNLAGESVPANLSLGKRWAKRIDAAGSEEEDGRIIGLGVCRFITRFDATLFSKGGALVILDFENDEWEVSGPPNIIDGRRRYMEFKCRRRGDN